MKEAAITTYFSSVLQDLYDAVDAMETTPAAPPIAHPGTPVHLMPQDEFDSNLYAPLADAPEDYPPLGKRVRDLAATSSSSTGKSKRCCTNAAVAKPPAGSYSDEDYVASDSDVDVDALIAAPPPTAKKRGASKTANKRKGPVKIDPNNVEVYPPAEKVRATVIERARAHGHTVREVGDEHVIVHHACDLSPFVVDNLVSTVRDTVRSPEMR